MNPAAPPAPEPPGDILIVDDTPASLKVLVDLLGGAGYQLRPATSGELALRSVAAQAPALILLDVKLPGLDGYEVCRRLKAAEQTRAIPVIFISVHNTEQEKLLGFQAGGVDYITKPYQAEEVLARVKTHLTLHQLHQELRTLNQTLEQQVLARTAALAQINAALERENEDRRRLELALRQSERRYRGIVETAGEGIWLIDDHAVTQFVNAKMAAMLGYTPAAMLGRHLFDFMDAAGRRDAAEKLERRRQGINEQHEFCFLRQDHTPVWTSVNTNALLSDTGEFTGALAMVTDITERKRAADALRDANAYHRSLIEISLDPLVTIGPTGQITDVNAATERVTGYTRTELIGTDFSTYFTEPALARAGYQQVFRDGTVRDYPLEIRHRDGRRFDVLYNAAVYRDPAGQVAGVFAAARDITERKHAERAQAAERGRLQALIQSSRDGLVLFGVAGQVSVANQPALDALGWTGQPADWLGRPFDAVLAATPAPAAQAVLRDVWQHLQSADLPLNEAELTLPARSLRWVGLPVVSEGEVLGRLLVLYDVTRERELEKLHTDLTHMLVHDLRNPLTNIQSATQFIEWDGLATVSPDQRRMLAAISDASASMLRLVSAILEVSRLESDPMPLHRERLPLAALMTQAVQVQAPLAAERQLRFETHWPADLPDAYGDADLIQRVLQNLLGNALKFTPAGGVVRIGAHRQPAPSPFVQVWVSDSGPGLAAELRGRLFQKFATGQVEHHGSGLGLAFCRLAVEAHGGRIWAESEPGAGATFRFTVPSWASANGQVS
ncbi:MAG: PAS domain S-box protein [Anaerolineales bacterium]|nr:PAS domain S-box protein [Anaerolineales bacterium]